MRILSVTHGHGVVECSAKCGVFVGVEIAKDGCVVAG